MTIEQPRSDDNFCYGVCSFTPFDVTNSPAFPYILATPNIRFMDIKPRVFNSVAAFGGVIALIGCTIVLVSWITPVKVRLPPIAKELNKQFSYIPSGTMELDSTTVSLHNFYMSKTEVSNAEYQAFLSELKTTERIADLALARIDSAGWKDMTAFRDYYHKHPAYSDYPVVNISHEAAILYCKWLTDKWNKASKNGLVYEFRLPQRAEFIYAAGHGPYAWPGPYIRNGKNEAMCNYNQIGDAAIHRDEKTRELIIIHTAGSNHIAGSLSDKADVTTPVKSHFPNQYELYNLNGNAAEMIDKKGIAVGGDWSCPGYDVRNESTQIYSGPTPFVGFRPVMVVTMRETGK